MKLKEAIEIGRACGMRTLPECIMNIDHHATSLFKYIDIEKELTELINDVKDRGLAERSKMNKKLIDVAKVRKLYEELAEINSLDFDEIIFLENGLPITEGKFARENFKFMGLNNVDYILAEVYKEDFDKDPNK